MIYGMIKKAAEVSWFLACFENADVLVATGTSTAVGRGFL